MSKGLPLNMPSACWVAFLGYLRRGSDRMGSLGDRRKTRPCDQYLPDIGSLLINPIFAHGSRRNFAVYTLQSGNHAATGLAHARRPARDDTICLINSFAVSELPVDDQLIFDLPAKYCPRSWLLTNFRLTEGKNGSPNSDKNPNIEKFYPGKTPSAKRARDRGKTPARLDGGTHSGVDQLRPPYGTGLRGAVDDRP